MTPQIVYPSAAVQSGGAVLAFVYPPRHASGYEAEEIAETDFSSYGDDQTVLERVDHFISFDMPMVRLGADAAAWQAFLDWSATGGHFDYYPDASQGAYTTCHRVSKGNKIAYHAPGLYEISGLRFRQVIA